ncbi:U7 snRNA-associated Sm-like protein LSm10 [Periplaneta americana]|uniref:U7 snRNA-associated Sm-like protein LSm10 n=1 Tax=Periplaneta americana TaxID=6978 RepID=UPI0037E74F9D
MALVSRKEKHFMYNGLVCLVQGLEGKYTTVDLRNESSVTGKIEQVDGFMNIVMTEAVFIDAREREYPFDSFFIHARNIRYVHIPDKIQIVPTIKSQLKKIGYRAKQPGQESTWKGRKLLKRQKETLMEIEKLKKEKDKDVGAEEEKKDDDK